MTIPRIIYASLNSISKYYSQENFFICIYTITWLVCIFIGCWSWSIKETHTDGVRSRQWTCFSFFMPPKSFNKPFECLLYKTNRLHFPVRVYCNRSQKTSQCVNNNSHTTRLRSWRTFLHAVTSSVIYYSTHTRKNVIYLLNKIYHYYFIYFIKRVYQCCVVCIFNVEAINSAI